MSLARLFHWRVIGLGLVFAVGFAVAHTWAPLFYSNQNQYFLHGLAESEYGSLANDWLATTRDPTPIFSLFVSGIASKLPLWAFQVFFVLMLMIYFTAIAWWLEAVVPNGSWNNRLLSAAILLALHAAIFRFLVADLSGKDWLWYLQAGVAGQYVLGPGLQPSVFGVLLIAAFAAYAHDRPVSAILCSTLAAVLHATYLLPAALFTVGVMIDQARRGQWRHGLGLGMAGLLLVLPTLVYLWETFRPTNSQLFAQAQDILVNIRIPHHARIDCWLDTIAVLQWAWIIIGVTLIRPSGVFFVAMTALTGAMILTAIQWATGNATLALLFPWRISAIMMPLATAVIIGRIVALESGRWQVSAAVAITALSVAGGVLVFRAPIGYAITAAEVGILEYIAKHQQPHNVYFLPVRIPNIRSEPPGSQSRTFNTRPRTDNAIPWDFQRFRLATGARVFVDFKSIPYADVDVVEWYRRLRIADTWAKETDPAPVDRRFALHREEVTHIILPADRVIEHELFQQEYSDEFYRLYRIQP